MKKEVFNIPNIIMISRVVFLPLLYVFLTLNMATSFLITYILIGSTDFVDGKLARFLDQVTGIGKALDSICDLLFYISSAWFMYKLFYEYLEPNMTFLIVFFVFFGLSFVVSLVRLKKPMMMHTTLLRFAAVMVFILLVSSFFFSTTYLVTVCIALYLLGFIEEILIFILYGDVDPDTTSIFALMRHKTAE